MKGYKIFLSWLLTVIVGSIGLPLWANVFETYDSGGFRIGRVDEILLMSFLCMIVSAVLSAPTLIVLLIRNAVMKGKYSLRRHFRRINVTHIIMAVLTIFAAAGYLLITYMQLQSAFNSMPGGMETEINYLQLSLWPILTFSGVILWYMICAVPCWYLFFRKELREARAGSDSENSTVLDSVE